MSALALTASDAKLMLVANVHIGSKNLSHAMRPYIWRRRKDGVCIINIGKTWQKLVLAARVLVAIENPEDILALSGRPAGQRAVFKFAQTVGASYIGSRFTAGTLTNQSQARRFVEPRVLLVADPIADAQPIRESAYMNIPVIAICDSDAPLRCVDIAIPASNKSNHAIAMIFWLLTREILRMRGEIPRDDHSSIPLVDLFVQRDPEEVKKEQQEREAAAAATAAAAAAAAPAATTTDAANTTETNETDTAAAADNWQTGAF